MNPIPDTLTWRQPVPQVSADVAATLTQLFLDLEVSPYDDLETFLVHCRRAAARLPSWLLLDLQDFATRPTAPGALLIRGLPVDPELPPTPDRDGRPFAKRTFVSEGSLLTIAQLIGVPMTQRGEQGEQGVHQVAPQPGAEDQRSNAGSSTDFGLHVENAFSDFRPSHLALVCLRPDRTGRAFTVLSDLRQALRRLDAETIRLLREPRYRIQAPDSFARGLGRSVWTDPVALVTGPDDLPDGRVRAFGVEPIDAAARLAYERLLAALHHPDVVSGVRLDRGDLLLMANGKGPHGRTPFERFGDGQDRWLQRAYTRPELWSSRTTPGAPPRILPV